MVADTDLVFLESKRSTSTLAVRALQLACLFLITAYCVAIIFSVALIREGDLLDFSLVKLMKYIPENVTLWQLACIASAVATVSFTLFVVALSSVLRARASYASLAAVVLAVLGAASNINGQTAMLVLFADLCRKVEEHKVFPRQDLVELGWLVLNQSMTQTGVVGNTFFALFRSLDFPYCPAHSCLPPLAGLDGYSGQPERNICWSPDFCRKHRSGMHSTDSVLNCPGCLGGDCRLCGRVSGSKEQAIGWNGITE